jgi:sugar O-acyltransferase (sialic acid O-acetyltransferase NeuD family)
MEILGYFDKEEAKQNPYGLSYMGCERQVNIKNRVGQAFVFPAIGDNIVRASLVQLFDELDMRQFILIDPSAKISPTAILFPSTYIGKNVCINAQSKVGKGAIINTGAVIEHESKIGDFAHIAPAAVLCGDVEVGIYSFIGANAVVKQGINIGSNAVIGAGSVVLKNIPNGEVWIGNPAKKYLP